jgi:hypothetical protein
MLPLIGAIALLASNPPASPQVPVGAGQVRQAVERSLVSLEKGAADWMNGNNQVGVDQGRPVLVKGPQKACASCHHVPMTVWCMTEAENYGFKVNKESLDEFRHWSLTAYLKHPDLQPFAQDKFGGAKTSLNTIYLSVSLFAAEKLDEQATEALKQFAAHLMAKQEADGSWKSGRTGYEPPIGDDSEVLTMQALLGVHRTEGSGPGGVQQDP